MKDFLTRKRFLNKFDVITQKQANNICLAELAVATQSNGHSSVISHSSDPPKGLNNMGNT